MKSYQAKPAEVEAQRAWLIVDAAGKPLGRLATEIATRLRGKHKPIFTPNVDCGDYVIVINAGQVALTGRKAEQRKYYRHSGYPGSLRELSYGYLRERKPEFMVELAVRRMLPKTVQGRQQFRRLKVYATAAHPHAGQQPTEVSL